MYHTAAYFEGKKSKSKELIIKKLENVAELRDSRSERRGIFENLWHKMRRKGSDLKDGVKAATS